MASDTRHLARLYCILISCPQWNHGTSADHLFRALADPTRIRMRILNLIANREICVCYFIEILQIGQSKVSRHLAYLRRAGIVAARRDSKWMHYRLVIPKHPVAASILRGTLKHLKGRLEMQRDLSRLTSACCNAEKYALLQRAPQPSTKKALVSEFPGPVRSVRP